MSLLQNPQKEQAVEVSNGDKTAIVEYPNRKPYYECLLRNKCTKYGLHYHLDFVFGNVQDYMDTGLTALDDYASYTNPVTFDEKVREMLVSCDVNNRPEFKKVLEKIVKRMFISIPKSQVCELSNVRY